MVILLGCVCIAASAEPNQTTGDSKFGVKVGNVSSVSFTPIEGFNPSDRPDKFNQTLSD
jgi:hypothetical protein